MCRISLMVFSLFVYTSLAVAQHAIENPQPGSTQSGVSAMTGWKCSATGEITVHFNSGPGIPMAYGTTRADTAGVCGNDGNNGISLLWNWNLNGDGRHTVEFKDNGVTFASFSIQVVTFGQPFMTGQFGVMSRPFAGRNTVVQWVEPWQNFVIVSTENQRLQDLSVLLGTWHWDYDLILAKFDVRYRFDEIDTSGGFPLVVGLEIDEQNIVGVARVSDLSDDPFPRTFMSVQPGTSLCRVFIFDLSSPASVEGEYIQFTANCSEISSSILYEMTGVKTAEPTVRAATGAGILELHAAAMVKTQVSDPLVEQTALLVQQLRSISGF